MVKDRKLKSWPFYALALIGAALGIPMLVTGLKAAPPAQELVETVSGRVVSVSWVSNPQDGQRASMMVTLRESERTFFLSPVHPERRTAYEQLVGVQVEVLVDGSPGVADRPVRVFRLTPRNGGQEWVEPPSINYDHKGKTSVTVSRVKWGAALVALSAVFFVLGHLVDAWNRNRREIMGS